MTNKTRSPLHGATRSDVAALRALIVACLKWERALGTPSQFLHADEPIHALTALSFATVDKVRQRSLARWREMDHYDQSYAVYDDQHLRRYNHDAWEKKQLRAEVEGLRADVAEMKAAIG